MLMVSQVLGLDNDRHASKVILGFLLSIGSIDPESNLVRCFNFDEFLAETIHTQLVEFPKVRFFKYHSYLLNILLCSNVSELQFLSTMFSSDLPKQISMFEFVNMIMTKVYKIIFDDVLPRVLEDMRVTCLLNAKIICIRIHETEVVCRRGTIRSIQEIF